MASFSSLLVLGWEQCFELKSEVHSLCFSPDPCRFWIVLAICQMMHCFCFVFSGLSGLVQKEKVNDVRVSLLLLHLACLTHRPSDSQTAQGKVELLLPWSPWEHVSE